MEPTCPICGNDCGTRNEVRRHLHVRHRKFEILDALLEEVEALRDGEEPRPAYSSH